MATTPRSWPKNFWLSGLFHQYAHVRSYGFWAEARRECCEGIYPREPTFTLALLPGSPAIDAGDDTACPLTDQRGLSRPIGAHCDIGAFEFVPIPSIVRGPNGKVRLDFVLQPNRTNTIEASTNLVDWRSLGMVTSTTDGLIEFKDQNVASFSARFYRIR